MTRRPTVLRRFMRSYAWVLSASLLLVLLLSVFLVREAEIRSETRLLRDRTIVTGDLIESVAARGTTAMEMSRQLRVMSSAEGMLFYLMSPDESLHDAFILPGESAQAVFMSSGGQGGAGEGGGQGGPGGGGQGAHGTWGVELQSDSVAELLSRLLSEKQVEQLSAPSAEPQTIRIPTGNPFQFPVIVAGWRIDSGTLFLLRAPDYRAAALDTRLPLLYIGILAGLLVIAGLTLLMISGTLRRLLRPFRETGAVAEGIVEGRYDRRVPAYREEELATIGDSVNRMVEKLQRLEEARLAGTARLAHELRTPLTILRSSLQGIRDGVVHPDEVPAFIEASLSETTRLQGLVGDLVDLSVLESSDMTLDIRETDVNALLDSVVDETRPACQSGGHTLALKADPGMTASIDPARTRQVLLNLLGKSIRHAGAGRNILIQAHIHGGMLTVAVRDDGPGIPAEVLPQLFERYGRAGAAAGSGLGLAISRAIVEAHGGDIRVESDSSTYTMFVFRLPT